MDAIIPDIFAPIEGAPVEVFEMSHPDLQIEVWAQSPLIASPVAMDTDAEGRYEAKRKSTKLMNSLFLAANPFHCVSTNQGKFCELHEIVSDFSEKMNLAEDHPGKVKTPKTQNHSALPGPSGKTNQSLMMPR